MVKKIIDFILHLLTFGWSTFKRISKDQELIDSLIIGMAETLELTDQVSTLARDKKLKLADVYEHLNIENLKAGLERVQKAHGTWKRVKYNLIRLLEDEKIKKL